MPHTTEEILVRRPTAEVYAYMDAVDREREWQPSLREAVQEPAGPTRVGTRKRYVSDFLGKRVENTYVATAVEPGRRVRYESTPDSAVEAVMTLSWEPTEGGAGTRVTLTVEGRPRGMLRFVPRGVLEEAWQSQLRTTLRRLKERLEDHA